MKISRESLAVGSVPWNVFGTLTFSVPRRPEQAKAAWDSWLERMRRKCRIGQDRFFWLLRLERGELGGRLHLHCLLLVPELFIGQFVTPVGTASQAYKAWKPYGLLSRFRRIASGDWTVPYVFKDARGGDVYECNKTAGADLVLSDAALRWMRYRKRKGFTNPLGRGPVNERTHAKDTGSN